MKLCPSCGTEKPFTEFSKMTKATDGLQCYCKPCVKAWHAARRKATPQEVLRDKYYLKHYGVNYSYVTNLLTQQDCRCGVCGKDISDKFHLDHCHDTGKIRGALCPQCNHLLGLAYDNIETLERAIEYLRAAAEG